MTGYLRFTLAFMVFLSHLGVTFYGLNPGVVSVVIFYLLAGRVIARLFLVRFWVHEMPKRIWVFYYERFLRVYPTYLFQLLFTLFFLFLTDFGAPSFRCSNILLNLMVVPLNFYMYLERHIVVLTSTEPPWWLIPTAWSLGAELQAYLLLPLVLLSWPMTVLAFLTSVAIYLLSIFHHLHPDYFGYRLIPGIFFIFLSGALLHSNTKEARNSTGKLLLLLNYFLIAFFCIDRVFLHPDRTPYVRETLIGYSVGLPLVYMTYRIRLRLPLNNFLANLSYPFFLAHFLSFWILAHLQLFPQDLSQRAFRGFLLTCFISLLLYISETPFKRMRFSLTRNEKI